MKLDVSKYSLLNDEREDDDATGKTVEIEQVMVLYRGTVMPYTMYERTKETNSPSDRSEITEYCRFVGKDSACRMLLCRE